MFKLEKSHHRETRLFNSRRAVCLFVLSIFWFLNSCALEEKIIANKSHLALANDLYAEMSASSNRPENLENVDQTANSHSDLSQIIIINGESDATGGAGIAYENVDMGSENPSVEEIRVYVEEVFGSDADQAMQIISYESGYRANAVGHNSNGTSDYGLMQINGSNIGVAQYPACTPAVKEAKNWRRNIDCGGQISAAARNATGYPFYWWSTACVLGLPCYANRN